MVSLQRWDGQWRLTSLQPVPVGQQFRLVLLGPFDDKRQQLRGQAAFEER
jgi:hypothetical protein